MRKSGYSHAGACVTHPCAYARVDTEGSACGTETVRGLW